MRSVFAEYLHQRMGVDFGLRLLMADVGYGILDRLRLDYPDRCTDFGASEQLMIGAACGMALSGLSPICYTITPFLLYRPFEWLRNYLHHDKINVKLVGAGRDRDYGRLGYTHWADDDELILACLPGIKVFKPTIGEAPGTFAVFLQWKGPAYLNLSK